MYYYSRNIGEYAKDTGHLTALQHGFYTLLLDRYYKDEKPIPDMKAHIYAKGERDDVLPVLEEFFKLTSKGWIHSHADRVIEAYHLRAEKNRKNGAKGGRPPSHEKPDGLPDDGQPEPESKAAVNRKPVTVNQVEDPPNPPAPPKKKRSSRLPPVGSEPYSPRFLAFWDAYPDGKRSKKLEAWKVWERDDLEDFGETIVRDVLERKVRHHDWVKDNGKYIPGAQVYLNGRRWNDDIAERRHEGRRGIAEANNMQTAQGWKAPSTEG